jgi:hypothetical protein
MFFARFRKPCGCWQWNTFCAHDFSREMTEQAMRGRRLAAELRAEGEAAEARRRRSWTALRRRRHSALESRVFKQLFR